MKDIENKIQQEIRKNVIRQYTKKQEEGENTTSYTLEALAEITDFSLEELNEIANETRHSYIKKRSRLKKLMIILVSISILILCAIAYFAFNRQYQEKIDSSVTYKISYTSALNKKNAPIDNLESISFAHKKFYFFVRFSNLKKGREFSYSCKMYDGSGEIVLDTSLKKYTPKGSLYFNWCAYKFRIGLDIPGKWKMVGVFNGKEFIKEFITVSAN